MLPTQSISSNSRTDALNAACSSTQTSQLSIPPLILGASCSPDDRKEQTLEESRMLIARNQKDWIFEGKSFSKESVNALAEHLQYEKCRVKSIKFINCRLDHDLFKDFFRAVRENTSLRTLHIESCVVNKHLSCFIREALEKGAYRLQTLCFVNTVIHPEALKNISLGILVQNGLLDSVIESVEQELNLPVTWRENTQSLQKVFRQVAIHCGIAWNGNTLSLGDAFKVCSSNLTLFQVMKTLFEKQIGVSSLCIEGCKLGASDGQTIKELLAESKKLREFDLQSNRLGSAKLIGRIGPAIKSIIEGLEVNTSVTNFGLSLNQLHTKDWLALRAVVEKNSTIVINVTGNMIESTKSHPRLITAGSTPRSYAISKTPRMNSVAASTPSKSLDIISSISTTILE